MGEPTPPRQHVICVVGPTASGKSAVAQGIAEALRGEVVSADSMQVYRGMDIGTGKLPRDKRRVAHHCLDLVEPGEPFSAALFQRAAREAFEGIEQRGGRCVLAGGTGLYVRAAVDDYRFPAGEQEGNPVRERYGRYAREHGAAALWELLHEADPESAALVHPNNTVRVVRALELMEEGESYARQREALAAIGPWAPSTWVGLAVEPDRLSERIDRRVDAMFDEGLVEEVNTLLKQGLEEALTASSAIGYKEVVEALRGRCTLEGAREAVKRATRRYAKRQRTWLRAERRLRWFDADALDDEGALGELVASIVEHVRRVDHEGAL